MCGDRPGIPVWLGLLLAAAPPAARAQTFAGVGDVHDRLIAATAKRTDTRPTRHARSLAAEPLVKIHPTLRHAADALARLSPDAAATRLPLVSPTPGRQLPVDLRVTAVTDELLGRLATLGFQVRHASPRGLRVSGRVAADRLSGLAALPGVMRIKPLYRPLRWTGSVTTEGDAASRAAEARAAFGVTGAGVRVGVLSDSCAVLSGGVGGGTVAGDVINGGTIGGTSSQASGDLPEAVVNVQDINPAGTLAPTAGDEGRAMLEIVHDLAPDAALSFATAIAGEAGFADNILALAQAPCRVICDDVLYLNEPMFQDGLIAQAVDRAVQTFGATYFSAAGNLADDSYESPYRDASPTDTPDSPPADFDDFHDFDAGPTLDTSMRMTVGAGGHVYAVLQWNEPFAAPLGSGAVNDFDLYVLSADGTTISLAESSYNDSIGDDPLEIIMVDNTGSGSPRTFCLGVDHYIGPEGPVLLRMVFVGSEFTIEEHDTHSPTVYGHAASARAMAVAAQFYGEVGSGGVTPPGGVENVEPFSSLGPATIYFSAAGALLAAPQVRPKPDLTAPDGGNTSFYGEDIDFDADAFPNFFGTSAAAPHAAAVAALLIEYMTGRGQNAPPAEVYERLRRTAVDIESPGVDSLSGAGRIDAVRLLAELSRGDLDADGDVDLDDFSVFQTCVRGSSTPAPEGCSAADLNADGHVDLADFVILQQNFTGVL